MLRTTNIRTDAPSLNPMFNRAPEMDPGKNSTFPTEMPGMGQGDDFSFGSLLDPKTLELLRNFKDLDLLVDLVMRLSQQGQKGPEAGGKRGIDQIPTGGARDVGSLSAPMGSPSSGGGGSRTAGPASAARDGATSSTATADVQQFAAKAGGSELGKKVMERAKEIGDEINRTGGYRFDGKNDCYGFVRRVWDPILKEKGLPPLPVNDGPNSPNWRKIGDWDSLKPGDVLSTHQGHSWGKQWHGGIYAGKIDGKHYIYDNSGSKSAKLRELPNDAYFSYVYRPTEALLGKQPDPEHRPELDK